MSETIVNAGAPGKAGWKIFADKMSRQLAPLEAKALCANARHRTRLEDFGDPPLEPALSVLMESLEHEAGLHPLGRLLMRVHLRDLLETRLRLADAWKNKLETIEASGIERPVVITGMPRSGSTFLHELLAEDPGNRAPRVWEVMFPIPAWRRKDDDRDLRIWKAAASLWWFRRLAPRADSVYPMRAGTPHECVAIHSYTLLSEEFVSTCRIPSYEKFLRSADLGPAYRWQRRFLQHLQFGRAPKRWVLKSPDHVYGLDALLGSFPEAVIIQTHRNPIEALESSSQLTEVLHGLFAWPEDCDQIWSREVRVLAEGMDRFVRFRDSHPELSSRFIDVSYPELVRDPLAIVRRIYERLDIPLTEPAIERMRLLVSNRSRYRRRRAVSARTDRGPDAAAEARRFERYCSRFGISCQSGELK